MTGIVLAHNGVAEAVERHKPTWLAAFDQVIVISPHDDYLPGSVPMGRSQRNGVDQIERMIFACVMASRFPMAAILEYDTVFFGAKFGVEFPAPRELACSQVFRSDNPNFAAPIYGHSPWIATGETWWRIATSAGDAQHGVPDRWLALAAYRANVDMCGIEGAFSAELWDKENFEKARKAAKEGSTVFHGCKTAQDFAMLSFWRNAPCSLQKP